MNSLQICVPDPSDPAHPICQDIPVLIDPVGKIPDPKILGELTEPIRTDIGILVAVDQLAARAQDESMRSRLVELVDELLPVLSARLPDGASVTRTGRPYVGRDIAES